MGYVSNLSDDYIMPNSNDEYYVMFSQKLRSILDDKGWDARTLARKSGLRESNISRYLSGERLPSLISFGKIVEALDCEVDDLLDY